MAYRWKDDPWWSEAPGRPFRLAALGLAVGLPALLFAALVRNAVVQPTTPADPISLLAKRMTGDPDRDVRLDAIRELWQGEHKDKVIEALHGAPHAARIEVADFLVEQGPEVVPELLGLLFDQRARSAAIGVILRLGPAAAPRLIAELPQSSDDMTTILFGILAGLGPAAAEQTVPAARQMLRTGDAVARRAAGEALGQLGPTAIQAIPDLIAAVGDANLGVRMQCMQTLSGFGAAADSAVPAIAKSLRDPLATGAACVALGKIGVAAIEPLAAALDDPAPEVRQAAAEALGAIGSSAVHVKDRLLRLSQEDANFRVRRAAGTALDAITAAANSR